MDNRRWLIFRQFSKENKLNVLRTIHQNKVAINDAKEEALYEAETQIFRYVFGIDGPEESAVDELGRPVEES